MMSDSPKAKVSAPAPSSRRAPTPVFFHEAQLQFKPMYEWAFGEKIPHPETTARAESIVAAVDAAPADFLRVAPKTVPMAAIRAQHSYSLLTLYNTAATTLQAEETFYPMVFPRLRDGKGDPTNLHQAGAFCFDSGTPLAQNTAEAANWSAACAVEAATAVAKKGEMLAYAVSRPPGHHATKNAFGGYCYFNNSGLAARLLRRKGRVAVIDIDYHHGNGTQSLFYRDANVLTLSIHGDPQASFPYFAGFAAETGEGRGLGYNINVPLPHGADGQGYMEVVEAHVIPALRHFGPEFLVIAAGFDTYALDPVGHFTLRVDDYHPLGVRFGQLGIPTVVVQEGGYHAEHLGMLATTFLRGMRDGQLEAAAGRAFVA